MFPLRDDIPTLLTPITTIAIIVLNVLAWVLIQGLGGEPALSASVCELGLVPGEPLGTIPVGTRIQIAEHMYCVLGRSSWFNVLSSMFLHGSWFHLIGNMWFLWVFGNNVEDVMGRFRFVAFYLLCGIAAATAQIMANPHSALPMVGASGAIGGVMGAYAVTYPSARVATVVILGFFIRTVWVPAPLMLGYWFILQVLSGLPSLGQEVGGVAFWAHVGGFLAGIALMFFFRDPGLLAAHRAHMRDSQSARRFEY
jgi:membrane associated rhomboid family serine protease